MFITNKEKMVNIDNVTSMVQEGDKIIFNLDYGITLKGSKKIIPDYVYFYCNGDEVKEIVDTIVSKGWIQSVESNHPNRYINPEKISFLKWEEFNKYNEPKNRIIINFNVSVSFNGSEDLRTSDSIYLDFNDSQTFNSEKGRISSILERV